MRTVFKQRGSENKGNEEKVSKRAFEASHSLEVHHPTSSSSSWHVIQRTHCPLLHHRSGLVGINHVNEVNSCQWVMFVNFSGGSFFQQGNDNTRLLQTIYSSVTHQHSSQLITKNITLSHLALNGCLGNIQVIMTVLAIIRLKTETTWQYVLQSKQLWMQMCAIFHWQKSNLSYTLHPHIHGTCSYCQMQLLMKCISRAVSQSTHQCWPSFMPGDECTRIIH